jgi:cysteinyl-tRNA synthetase
LETGVTLRENNLHVYNTLTRSREKFVPLAPPHVGMYVCGPTVYGDAHIGHAKSYVSFDVMVRYLRHLGYQVTYIQNITDVGHLTDDADQGEDKVERKARAEQVHPMQIAEGYTRSFFDDMDRLNVLRPDISPRASGHVIEQIELVKTLLAKGHAYESNGSVYFDVASWPTYGKLSGRSVDQMQAGARVEVSAEKRHPADFAIWKRAEPGHIMQWPSPWGMGFPGWHLECSAMSMKYLGETLDIHGGGLENSFPHHDDEIAQSEAATGKPFVKYWLHNNMVTVGGQKMGKSLGNFITLKDAFKKWRPTALRMFILQSHYRSPLDFSDEAVEAAGKSFERLNTTYSRVASALKNSGTKDQSDFETANHCQQMCARTTADFRRAMDEDFNTAVAISAVNELVREVNKLLDDRSVTVAHDDLKNVNDLFRTLATEVLGLKLFAKTGPQPAKPNTKPEVYRDAWRENKPGAETRAQSVTAFEAFSGTKAANLDKASQLQLDALGNSPEETGEANVSDQVMAKVISWRANARKSKDFAQADSIRKDLEEIGIILEDTPEGTKWRFK